MSAKHLKLLELLSTSSCVKLVTRALTVFKLHRKGGGGTSEAPQAEKVKKSTGGRELSDPNTPSAPSFKHCDAKFQGHFQNDNHFQSVWVSSGLWLSLMQRFSFL